jgi:hypothetical protein
MTRRLLLSRLSDRGPERARVGEFGDLGEQEFGRAS